MFAWNRFIPLSAIFLLLAPGTVDSRAVTAAPQVPILVDHFTGRVIDSSLWTASDVGDGPGVAARHRRLEVTIPASSAPASGDSILGAGVVSRCAAAADFDVQVGYSLLAWPALSGVRVGLRLISSGGLLSPGAQVERTSFGATDYPGAPREVYLTFDPDQGQAQGITATNDLSGKLRLVRTGDTMTGSYWHDGQWTLIHAGPSPTGAVSFALAVWSFPGVFAHQRVQMAFHDFMINQGQVNCTQVFAKRIGHNYAFSPRRATVKVGTRVVWENDAGTLLTITSDSRAWKFDKKMRKGARVSFVFTRPGTYRYHSRTYPSLKGRVAVSGEPSG